MRRAAKVDDNQREIVAALRDAGRSVVLLHAVGGGIPDLLVGYEGRSYLMEVKNKNGKNRLTDKQVEFIEHWNGSPPIICRTPIEALAMTEVEIEF